MKGRRIHICADIIELEAGDYYKAKDGTWYCRTPPVDSCPEGLLGNLKAHTVIEHKDGTITVLESIGVRYAGASGWDYHGYLELGVWRDV